MSPKTIVALSVLYMDGTVVDLTEQSQTIIESAVLEKYTYYYYQK